MKVNEFAVRVDELMGYLLEYDENEEVAICLVSNKKMKSYNIGKILLVDDAAKPFLCIEVTDEINHKKQ